MGVFTLTGTIVSIGQSMFDLRGTGYAFIEIVEPSGRRVMVQKVAVGNQVLSAVNLGCKGEFFFDKVFVSFGCVSQLWGVKTQDGLVAFEDSNIRRYPVVMNLCFGFIGSLLVVGIPFLVLGLLQWIGLILRAGQRKRLFYGNDYREANRLRQQQAVRI